MSTARAAPTSAANRSRTLDVFRGATVALMVLVNNPGSWQHLYPPLAHAPWHGCTATDLVFPFFLTAVGLSLALVMPGLQAGGAAAFWRKWLQRGLLIFAVGLVLNAAPMVRWDAAGQLVLRDIGALRFMGVLQRIALAWMGAALLLWWLRWPLPRVLRLVAALLLGYWAMLLALGGQGAGPTGGDPLSLEGFFGTALDRALLGPRHLYQGEGVPFDPEGLGSTLPAVAQVLLGWAVGTLLHPVLTGRADAAERHALLLRLMVWATLGLAWAHLWQLGLPLNKKLWTGSYVLHTTALAMLVLGVLLHLLDGDEASKPANTLSTLPAWLRPLQAIAQRIAMGIGQGAAAVAEAYGKNALAIFVLSGLLPRFQALARWADGVDAEGALRFITPLGWLYRTVFEPLASDPRLGSLLMALCQVTFYWLIARAMDRRGWYIKL